MLRMSGHAYDVTFVSYYVFDVGLHFKWYTVNMATGNRVFSGFD